MFPWLVAGGLAALEVALTAWAWPRGSRAPEHGSRFACRVALLLALFTIPLVPAIPMPVRVDRVHYAGPDLLSPEPVRSLEEGTGWLVPGVVRRRTVRTLQAGTLLWEEHRTEAGVPWVLLGVVGACGVVRRSRRPGRG